MAMTELQVKVPELAPVQTNFEQVQREVEMIVAAYDGLIYDEDQLKQAKADKAQLNKLKAALNDARKKAEREYTAPVKAFKTQVDALIATVDGAVKGIDAQLQVADDERKDRKRKTIEELFAFLKFPEWVLLEKLWNPRWLNVSYSIKAIQDDLETYKVNIQSAINTIDALNEYCEDARKVYMATLDLNAAIARHSQLVDMERRVKKQQAEEAAAQEKQVAHGKAEMDQHHKGQEFPRKWIAFDALLNTHEAATLSQFLHNNGICYRPHREN